MSILIADVASIFKVLFKNKWYGVIWTIGF